MPEKEVVVNENKIPGLSIAALVLGIISLVSWCLWFVSIPCGILALIFGIIGLRKNKKGFAITGLVTGSITLAIWAIIMTFAVAGEFADALSSNNYNRGYKKSSSYSRLLDL